MREEEQKVVVVYLFFFLVHFWGFFHIVEVSMVTSSGRGMDRVRNGVFKKLLPIEPPDF